jgi:GNAT superfamily N-acetyltransferase
LDAAGYVIDQASPEELPLLRDVELAAAQQLVPHGVALQALERPCSLEELQTAQAAGTLWIARCGGAPVGFALVEIFDGEPHLEEIDVHPSYGRRGIGAALIRTVIAWAKERGHRCITLTCFRHVPWNAPFYARLGFRPITDLTPKLAAIVREEEARGFHDRVVMRLDLR